jgi:hypothetical protein
LTLDELRAFLVGIAPGWYTSRDLHLRYAAWAQREGKPVVTVKGLGESMALNLEPKPERRWVRGHRAIWMITERMTREATPEELFAEGRDWFVEPS